ncbi:MAG: ethylbenzene dehydrogenase-related protein [Campylobacterota bacterium]|nr:ethylbenzene dehydrogenase-related protein [Campylobacterota bacterium]
MRTIAKSIIATSLVASALCAEGSITAVKVGNDVKPAMLATTDKLWDTAKATDVALYPQTTIRLNDKKANAANAKDKGKIAKVSALYNDKCVAFKIVWADGTESIQAGLESDEYPDGFAVQIATKFDDPKKLPYIGMGSDGRPVLVHLNKAVAEHFEPNGNKDVSLQVNRHQTNAFAEDLSAFDKKVVDVAETSYKRSFISEGFRSMTEIKDGSSKFNMAMDYNKDSKSWSGTMGRHLKDENIDLSAAGAIPVAFAVWDGEKMGRDGLKHLSTWIAVDFEGKEGNEALVAELTAAPKGNAEAGKPNVEAMCASCHTLNAEKVATPFMAPDLSNIGGYSTAAYLAESITDPSAVVVPGYNRNAHKNFAWYNVDDKGIRASTMPPMMTDEAMINDAVAYLMTLKAEVTK